MMPNADFTKLVKKLFVSCDTVHYSLTVDRHTKHIVLNRHGEELKYIVSRHPAFEKTCTNFETDFGSKSVEQLTKIFEWGSKIQEEEDMIADDLHEDRLYTRLTSSHDKDKVNDICIPSHDNPYVEAVLTGLMTAFDATHKMFDLNDEERDFLVNDLAEKDKRIAEKVAEIEKQLLTDEDNDEEYA